VLDRELLHREVLRVSRDESRAYAERCGSDEAIGLAERYAAGRKLAPPAPGALSLLATQWCEPETVEQALHGLVLARMDAANDLLDVDRADVRHVVALTVQMPDAVGGTTPAERVDEDSRIE
jgi:hypothetical protein